MVKATNECRLAKVLLAEGYQRPSGSYRNGKADQPFPIGQPMYVCQASMGTEHLPMPKSQRNQLLAEGQQGCDKGRDRLGHLILR